MLDHVLSWGFTVPALYQQPASFMQLSGAHTPMHTTPPTNYRSKPQVLVMHDEPKSQTSKVMSTHDMMFIRNLMQCAFMADAIMQISQFLLILQPPCGGSQGGSYSDARQATPES
jgi:hypothetical protein